MFEPTLTADRTSGTQDPPSSREFQERFLSGLVRDCYAYQFRNIEFWRGGYTLVARLKKRLKDVILAALRARGFVRIADEDIERASHALLSIWRNADRFEAVHAQMADEYSKTVLIDLLRYRMLGPERVRLPKQTGAYWRHRGSIGSDLLLQRRTMRIGRSYLNLYRVNGTNGALTIHASPLGILTAFLLEQYAYRAGEPTIEAELGDTVIDAGGCWGDTALYFADKVGSHGRVYCVEMVPENLNILRQNLAINAGCRSIVTVIEKALWRRSGDVLSVAGNGAGASVGDCGAQDRQVDTVSIDDLVAAHDINRVDFIKMDIEGAELEALRGAERTLRRFRPKLAISVYHRADDLITIPEYLRALGLGYRFFMDHFTIFHQETVLFAVAETGGAHA